MLPHPAVTLRATYYDTPDQRLARAGISLRYRKGDAADKVWTAKLPSDTPGTRHEICRPGPAGHDATGPDRTLLTAYHRGDPLTAAVVVRTVRRTYEIRDAAAVPLVEIADDVVSVLDGRRVARKFREVEVERLAGRPKLLDRVEAVLCAAGAKSGGFTPKHIRALGEPAPEPADIPDVGRMPKKPFAADVVAAALRKDVDPDRARTTRWSGCASHCAVGTPPCTRCGSGAGGCAVICGPSVPCWTGTGRIRSARICGGSRTRSARRGTPRCSGPGCSETAAVDALAPLEPAAIARIDADLAARHEEALLALDALLESDRYLALLDALVNAARDPQAAANRPRTPARWALPPLVAKPWHQLVRGNVRRVAHRRVPGRGLARGADPRKAGPVRDGGGGVRPRRSRE